MENLPKTAFVPTLVIAHGTMDLKFHEKALEVIEPKHVTNDDGSIHVSEMLIDGAMFHFHERVTDNVSGTLKNKSKNDNKRV